MILRVGNISCCGSENNEGANKDPPPRKRVERLNSLEDSAALYIYFFANRNLRSYVVWTTEQ